MIDDKQKLLYLMRLLQEETDECDSQTERIEYYPKCKERKRAMAISSSSIPAKTGKPACIHIKRGRGVCGTCLDRDETIVVPDVHKFAGHIACDSASNSEIVIPIHRDREVAAVLDIDSPVLDRFSEDDRIALEGIVAIMEQMMEW